MNKKVSTLLTVALTLGGSLLSSSAFAQSNELSANTKLDGKTYYYLGTASTTVMDGSAVNDGDNAQYTKLEATAVNATTGLDESALWSVKAEEFNGGYVYTIVNKVTGKPLAFKADGTIATAKDDGVVTKLSWGSLTDGTYKANGGIITTAGTNQIQYDSEYKISASGTAIKIFTVDSEDVLAATLNGLAGDHFSLTFPDVENLKENVFANELVALTVTGSNFATSTTTDEKEVVFAIKSSVPATTIATGTVASGSDVFKGIKFVVLSPKDKAPIGGLDNAAGEGYTFTTAYGRDLVADNAEAKDGKVSIANARFNVKEESVNKKGEYVVSLKKPHIYNEETKKQAAISGKVVVNALQAGDNFYVTTQLSTSTTPLKPFKAGTTSYVSAEDVLKVKAISVVNIYNMTEDDANYGEALSNASSNQWVAPKLLDLDAPEGQWIITSKDGKFTFSNRENGTKYEGVTLFKTDVANVYTVQAASPSILNGKTIKLDYKAIEATDGFAVLSNDDLDMYTYNIGFTAPMYNSPFFITGEAENNATAALDQDETKAASFSITKYSNSADENVLNVTDTIYSVQEYSFINDKKEVENKKDTLKVLAYTFNLTNEAGDKFYFASGNKFVAGKAEDMRENAVDAKAYRFILKETATGYKAYALDKALSSSDKAINVVNTKVLGMTTSGTLALGTTATITDMVIEKVLPGTSLDMTNGHVKFAAQGGGYFALNEKNEGVMAQTVLKAAATEEDLTFYLDTVDADALVPSFYITKGVKAEAETKAAEATRLYMYRPAADSLSTFNKAEAKYELNEDYAISGDVDAKTGEVSNAVVKVLFREAARNGNTIELTQNGEKVTVAAKAEGDVLGGVNDFRFQIVQAGDEEGVYYIKSGKNYVSNKNNVLVYSNEKSAQAVVVEATEAPTSNESVSATEVKVVANNGSVVVKNAAGKNVVVSTILGQVVANEVLTSDNATINVPAGIVVVAVEGESFKVNVK